MPKKLIPFLLLFNSLIIPACTKVEQERYYTQEEVIRITDSARKAQYQKAKKAADEDLRIRKEIEIRQRMEQLKNQKK